MSSPIGENATKDACGPLTQDGSPVKGVSIEDPKVTQERATASDSLEANGGLVDVSVVLALLPILGALAHLHGTAVAPLLLQGKIRKEFPQWSYLW